MNYREQLLRNQLKKQIVRDELLINTNPTAKNYQDLETKLKEANKDLQEVVDFFKNECGFTDYPHARGLLNKKTVKELVEVSQNKDQIIQILQQEIKDKDQELNEHKISYLNKLLQKEKENQENIKYYINQYHKKGKLGTKLKGRHVDELLENEINLERTIKGLIILADKRKELLEQEKQALISLAKQKISNKKEAKELLEQLELRRQRELQIKDEEIKQEQEKLTGWRNTLNTFFNKVGYGSYPELEKGLKNKEEMITNLQEQNKELEQQLNQKEAERLHVHNRVKEEMEKNKTLSEEIKQERENIIKEKEKLTDKNQILAKDLETKTQANYIVNIQLARTQDEIKKQSTKITELQQKANQELQAKEKQWEAQKQKLETENNNLQEINKELTKQPETKKTHYDLSDFKNWLNEKPERKEHLDWKTAFEMDFGKGAEYFDAFIEGRTYKNQVSFNDPDCQLYYHYYQVAQKWLTERERERERERDENNGDKKWWWQK